MGMRLAPPSASHRGVEPGARRPAHGVCSCSSPGAILSHRASVRVGEPYSGRAFRPRRGAGRPDSANSLN